MKRTTTIVLFASIFAVAVGTLGLSGNSAALMVSAVPQTQEDMGILGHVEYKHFDEFGNIKGYMQNDNIVVVAGKDCAAQYLFTDGIASVEDCIAGNAAFTYIGVGNGTILNWVSNGDALGATNATLSNGIINEAGTTAFCADDGATVGRSTGGDMARRNVTAQITSTGTTTIVILDTSFGTSGPFTFNAANATDVTDSGLFNGDYSAGPDAATHTCGAAEGTDDAGVNTNWNMFSRQLLNDDSGITVSDGDSLSVKWTITVG